MWDTIVARVRTRRPLWAVFPTPRFAKLLLALGVLWLVPGRLGEVVALAALGALLVVAIIDYVRLPGRGALDVTRESPATVGLGDDFAIRYLIASAWRWPSFVRVSDAVPTAIAVAGADGRHRVPPQRELVLDLDAVANVRGRYELGAIALRITTSLGLVQRLARFDLEGAIVVVPSLTNARRFRLLAAQNRLSEAGVRALRQRGEGTAFAGLRDYAPGDDPRMVDWKATARHAKLITREQTVERAQTVIAMIDCGRAMTQLAGQYPRFEHVLSAALVLADVAATSGDRVGMIAFDDTVRSATSAQRGTTALRGMRAALSALHTTMTEPDYAAAFRVLALRQRRRALVVLFTDVVDPRTARAFIAHTGRAAQRHVLVVVAIRNEALLAAARPTAAGSLAIYRSAAAEELIRERDESLARMRQAGVTVLDVAPGQMAAAVVNRYLEVKARGLL